MPKIDLAESRLITKKDTAEILGVSIATVNNWVKSGLLQSSDETTKRTILRNSVQSLKKKIDSGNNGKLQKRANKKFATTKRKHSELNNSDTDHFLDGIEQYSNQYTVDEILLAITYKLFSKEKNKFDSREAWPLWLKAYKEELDRWIHDTATEWGRVKSLSGQFQEIPCQIDILGATYQHISAASYKAKGGVYYTPYPLAKEIINDLYDHNDLILDPCCGSGSFLMAALQKSIENNETHPLKKIFGIDIDPRATHICRLNLLLIAKEKFEGVLHIYHKDSIEFLTEKSSKLKNFNLIVTNPPWGANFEFHKKNKENESISSDSFAVFFSLCLEKLSPNGKLSFLLPESFINVKAHSPIRKKILGKTSKIEIKKLGKVFKNLITNVVKINLLNKNPTENSTITLVTNKKTVTINQKELLMEENSNFVFDVSKNEKKLLTKLFNRPHKYIGSESHFALGIVTGNNAKLIRERRFKGSEVILRGKNIQSFKITPSNQFIKFDKKSFQQCPDESLFRADEKLIYRFISKNLVFAYDNQGRLTLNSANILIPSIGLPIKFILGIIQSKVVKFIFKSKFNTLKVLRKHIEEMPVFTFDIKTHEKIISIVDEILNSKNKIDHLYDKINDIIYKKLSLNQYDIDLIENFLSE